MRHISDVSEPASRLAQAQALQDTLGKLAQQHQAQDRGSDQSSVADTLQKQVDGIRGRTAGGSEVQHSGVKANRIFCVAGADGVQATTPATVVFFSGGGRFAALTTTH